MFKDLYYSFLEYLLILRKHIETKMVKVPPETWIVGGKGDVVLVPGFQETWVALKTPAIQLNNLGYKIHVLQDIQPNIFPIKYVVEKVRNFILANKLKKVILLAHSKGGIVNRFLLADEALYPKIKIVINIATPNNGSIFGFFRFHNLLELAPNSKILNELRAKERDYKKIYNIYPRLDNHVLPNTSLFLERAKNIEVDVVGHTRILESPKTLEIIRKTLLN